MSVIVKGMKMPTECLDCPFMISKYSDDCILQSDEANEKFETWEEMKEHCPLVELPEKHGDLIDRGELLKRINLAVAMMKGMMKMLDAEDDGELQMELKAYQDIRDGVKEEPTVLEAEDTE